jgi:hypothetical protein
VYVYLWLVRSPVDGTQMPLAERAQLRGGCIFSNRTLGFVNAPAMMQRAIVGATHHMVPMEWCVWIGYPIMLCFSSCTPHMQEQTLFLSLSSLALCICCACTA